MASVNRVFVIGNLGQDPEIRATKDGRELCTLSVATSEKWTDKRSGEKREDTEWHRVVVFSEHAVNYAKSYLKKGDKVCVEGKLNTRKWQAQDGSDRYTTEIVVKAYGGALQGLGSRARNSAETPADDAARAGEGAAPATKTAPSAGYNDLDDEIPF